MSLLRWHLCQRISGAPAMQARLFFLPRRRSQAQGALRQIGKESRRAAQDSFGANTGIAVLRRIR